MKPFNSQEYPNREYWKSMEEKHIKESNAGQSTPGADDLYYLAYVRWHAIDNKGRDLMTREQWDAQNRMLHCQKLREG